MNRLIALFLLCLASARLGAYGVSPNRAENAPSAVQPGGEGFQLQPAPQPSNNLAPGAMPQPIVQQSGQNIAENIKNYKPDDWAKAWDHIHIDDAERLSKDPSVLFADARSKAEYDQGHIPGAIPLPVGEFDTYFKKYESKIKAARKIVTYCHGVGCKLSDKCAQKLHDDHKMSNVASFFGGWPQWQEHKLPVEVGPEPKKR
jgi:rhodanese-related sulfurtransferase